MGLTKCVAFFSLFFDSILDFSVVCGGVREKLNSAFDRARRVLSWSLLLRLSSPSCANPSGKYANPDPRYPTCTILNIFRPYSGIGVLILPFLEELHEKAFVVSYVERLNLHSLSTIVRIPIDAKLYSK